MDMRAFFDTWFERFWINEDMSAADDMIPQDVTIRGLTDGPQISAQGMRDYGTFMLKHCDFSEVRIVHFYQQDDWAHMLVVMSGTQRGTDKPISFDVQLLARAENNQIVEAYNHLDHLKIFQDLGILPGGTFQRCFVGEPLV